MATPTTPSPSHLMIVVSRFVILCLSLLVWLPLALSGPTGNSIETHSSLRGTAEHRALGVDPRIVGGSRVTEPYPFFVEWRGRCGGTLIHEDIMLSAAHCNGRDESLGDPFSRRVYLGGRRRGTGVARNMAKRIPHPRWDDSLRSNIEWDFLVVKLNETTKGVEGLIPIPLNDQNDYPVGGETLTAIGYGRLTSGGRELPDMLRHVEIAAFSNERCGTYYGDTGVTFQQESMLCAGVDGGGRGTCQGDSGGPIIDQNGVQLGVTSWGEGCGANMYPGVYARVSSAKEWIDEQICRWSCAPPESCDPAIINDCAKDNIDGRVNLTLRVIHDAYPAETGLILDHLETATEYLFQDYGEQPPGPVDTVNNPVIVEFNVTNGRNGTYHFTIADSARDGICCEHGQGNVTIFNTDTGDVLFFNDNVTEKFQFWFTVDNVGTVLSTRIKEGADVEDEDNDMGEGVGIGGDNNDGPDAGGDYDPEEYDDVWPGSYPAADATNELHINLRFDDYPKETDWFFEQFTGSGNLAVSRSNTNSSNGRWVEIDSKNTSVRLDRRTFMSIPQSNLENRTLYRFRITDLTYDLGGDGMCCLFGYGWVTLTNGTRTESSPDGTVVWSLLGNEFTTEAEVYIWINGNGQTEVVAIDKDGGLRPDIPGNPVPGLSPDPGDGSDNADFLLPILENGNDAGNADNSPPTNSEPGNGGFLDIPVVGGGGDNAKGQSDRDPLIVQGEFP